MQAIAVAEGGTQVGRTAMRVEATGNEAREDAT